MTDRDRPEPDLPEEVRRLRGRVAALEAAQAVHEKMAGQVRDREALLRSMIENFPFDFWARDLEGRCFLQSAESIRYWGHLGGVDFDAQRVDDETLARWKANNQRALQGEVVRGEATLIPQSGEPRHYYQIVAPIVDGGVTKGLLGINIDVTDRKQAEEALEQERQSLRQLLDVYENHRQLIAYEIHDAVVQPLTASLMNLEATVRGLPPPCTEEAREGFARVMALVREGIAEARRVMGGLRPPLLDEAGLLPALEYLVAEIAKDPSLEVDYASDVQFDRLASPLETALYRIVQEALTNARRHSQSRRVRVRLLQQGRRLRVEIQDWGVGFDPEKVDHSRFGLKGIRHRAELFGGSTTIESRPGQGTRILVELPLVERAAGETQQQ